MIHRMRGLGAVLFLIGVALPMRGTVDRPILPAACSEREPNEQMSNATPLSSVEVCSGNAGVGDPIGQSFQNKGRSDGIEDLWKVTLNHRGLIRTTLDIQQAADLDVFLLRENPLIPGTLFEVSRSNSVGNLREETTAGEFLAPGTYFVGVSAFNGLASYVVKATVSPASPSDLNVLAEAGDEVTLTWIDKSDNESGFRIEARVGGAPLFSNLKVVGPNVQSTKISGLIAGTQYIFRIVAFNDVGGSPGSNEKAFTGAVAGCTASPTSLCLAGSRFRLEARYRTPQDVTGAGQAVALTSDTGYFWFFNPENVEMVVKVLDACSFSSHFWVFAGGLTNVEVEITVTDTQTETIRKYLNPLNTAFVPIQDTQAFATCP